MYPIMTGCGFWFITGLIVGSPPRSIWTSLPPVSSGAADRFITLLEWAGIYCTLVSLDPFEIRRYETAHITCCSRASVRPASRPTDTKA